MKKFNITLILIISLSLWISCDSPKASQMGNVDPETLGTGTLVYGDFTNQLFFSGDVAANNLLAGITGKLNIQGITGITAGFMLYGAYPAFAFTEKDRHTVWMFYSIGGQWQLYKLGGNPDVASDGASGYSSWFKEPVGITSNKTDSFFISDSENKKIKLIKNFLPSEYAVLSERPMGICIDSSANLYVTTKEGSILKIAAGTKVVTTVASGLGTETLYGITYDGGFLYFINGRDAYKIDATVTNGSPVKVISSSDQLTGSGYKDIVSYNGDLYISDSQNNAIYKTNAGKTGYILFAGAGGSSGDGVGLLTTEARFSQPYGLALDGANLYIADYFNNNVKRIQNLVSPTGVEIIDVKTAQPEYLFEPRAAAISPGGQSLYVAVASEYCIKRLYLDGTGTIRKYSMGGQPWAVYDVKVVQEKMQDGSLKDRYLYMVEVNKSTWYGRLSVYDLLNGKYKILYEVADMGKFTGSLAINSNASKIWLASRELNQGRVFLLPVIYDGNGVVSIPAGYDMSNPPSFLRKAGYYPSGIAFIQDQATKAEYILVGAYTGNSILEITGFQIDRFRVVDGLTRSDINPIVSESIVKYYDGGAMTSGYYYPLSFNVVGTKLFWSDYSNAKIYGIDALGTSAGQTAVSYGLTYQGSAFKAAGMAFNSVSGKMFFVSDSNNLVVGN